jgi:hypothetical protein
VTDDERPGEPGLDHVAPPATEPTGAPAVLRYGLGAAAGGGGVLAPLARSDADHAAPADSGGADPDAGSVLPPASRMAPPGGAPIPGRTAPLLEPGRAAAAGPAAAAGTGGSPAATAAHPANGPAPRTEPCKLLLLSLWDKAAPPAAGRPPPAAGLAAGLAAGVPRAPVAAKRPDHPSGEPGPAPAPENGDPRALADRR